MNIHSVLAAKPFDRSDRLDKRTAILRAATDVFASRGFFNAQVADVARAAGVAAGTVYLYFRSKDDLLVSIFERTMREAIADGHACVASLADPIERLRAIARVHLERLGRDRNLAIVFQVELRQSTKFMERFSATALRDYLGIIRRVIVEGQASGAFRPELNPTLAAKIFFGAIDEMATNWILSRRRYSPQSDTEAIVDIFTAGVANASPAGRRRRDAGSRARAAGGSAADTDK
jgi:TetR/AcrR family fatty acid metabolism transcriptional regulator